jgi:hypothetical protein
VLLSKNKNALTLGQKTVISKDGSIEVVLVVETDLITDEGLEGYDKEKFIQLEIDAMEYLNEYPHKIDRVEIVHKPFS